MIGIALALWLTPVFAADMPQTIDCNLVRQYVAEHGRAKALAWAIKEGYGWREIAAAKRCLK